MRRDKNRTFKKNPFFYKFLVGLYKKINHKYQLADVLFFFCLILVKEIV